MGKKSQKHQRNQDGHSRRGGGGGGGKGGGGGGGGGGSDGTTGRSAVVGSGGGGGGGTGGPSSSSRGGGGGGGSSSSGDPTPSSSSPSIAADPPGSDAASGAAGGRSSSSSSSSSSSPSDPRSLLDWISAERQGLAWVLGCAFVGSLLGLGIGTGHLTGAAGLESPWRDALGVKIRSTVAYEILTLSVNPWDPLLDAIGLGFGGAGPYDGGVGGGGGGNGGAGGGGRGRKQKLPPSAGKASSSSSSSSSSSPGSSRSGKSARNDPSHPSAYYALREMIVREDGGYVHPDLGFLVPAPCGASRGLGMVRTSHNACQRRCRPGDASEKRKETVDDDDGYVPPKNASAFDRGRDLTSDLRSVLAAQRSGPPKHTQEEVLLRVPLDVQLTREVALDALLSLVPVDVQRRSPLEDLDDGPLLALLLAHERGLGRESRYLAYVSTLPNDPPCGYASVRPSPDVLDAIAMLGTELGMDVNGWPAEVQKAGEYAERMSAALARDYGPYLAVPRGVTPYAAIQWALCHVSSRAVAARPKHGSLRLVPMMDVINHDADAGRFVELKGDETFDRGDFVESEEDDGGTFVVRSTRHGRRKPLRKGQELLANYNVPNYSPLDWYVSLGFVPPERTGRWTKIDPALPRVPRGGGGPTNAGGGGGGVDPQRGRQQQRQRSATTGEEEPRPEL